MKRTAKFLIMVLYLSLLQAAFALSVVGVAKKNSELLKQIESEATMSVDDAASAIAAEPTDIRADFLRSLLNTTRPDRVAEIFACLVKTGDKNKDYLLLGDIYFSKRDPSQYYGYQRQLAKLTNRSFDFENVRKESLEALKNAERYYLMAEDYIGASLAESESFYLGDLQGDEACAALRLALDYYAKGKNHPKRHLIGGLASRLVGTYEGELRKRLAELGCEH